MNEVSGIKKIKSVIKKENVKIIALRFTDLAGKRREVCYPANKFDDILKGKVDFDGSSVRGFMRIDEGSLSLLPEVSTFRVDPWTVKPKVGFMIADVIDFSGKLYKKSPRSILKRAIELATQKDHYFIFGVEMEFYFLKEEEGIYKLADTADYCEYPQNRHVFYELLEVIDNMGIDSEPSIHEHGPSQFEVHFAPDKPLEISDKILIFKDLAESVAANHGLLACFMPKPFSGLPGNGMHIHVSMWDGVGKKNLFWNGRKNELSDVGMNFMAGIIGHVRSLAAFFAPTVNSYKRLVPGFEAPSSISWGYDNRSTTFRISPFTSAKGAKLEFRAPDMATDPYLTFAGVIMAGLAGLGGKYELPPEAKGNVYQYTEEEKKRLKIGSLPEDLRESLIELEKDKFLMNFLGEAGSEYIRMKKEEWKEEMTTVWPIERDWYFNPNAFMREEIGRDGWRNTNLKTS